MNQALILLVGLIVGGTAHAQIVPDTLSNQRYFPLDVGNEWHYISIGFNSAIPTYRRSTIIGDTLVHNKQYFRYQSEGFDPSLRLESKSLFWVRYNEAGAVLFFSDLAADTSSHDSTTYWYHANFGDTLVIDQQEVFIGGTYDTTITFSGPIYVPVAAVKTLDVPDPLYGTSYYTAEVYAADIGLTFSESFDGPTTSLHYAKIGDIEYGTPAITVARETKYDEPHTSSIIAVYPNPAQDFVTLEYKSPQADLLRINVYDMLGRCLLKQQTQQHGTEISRTHLDVSSLPAGTYLVVITQSKVTISRSVLTIR